MRPALLEDTWWLPMALGFFKSAAAGRSPSLVKRLHNSALRASSHLLARPMPPSSRAAGGEGEGRSHEGTRTPPLRRACEEEPPLGLELGQVLRSLGPPARPPALAGLRAQASGPAPHMAVVTAAAAPAQAAFAFAWPRQPRHGPHLIARHDYDSLRPPSEREISRLRRR